MRKYFWPIILIIKLLASKLHVLRRILLQFGFYSPGPRSDRAPTRFQDTFHSYYSHASALGLNKNLNIVCEIGPGGTDYAQLAAADLGVEMFDQVDVIPLRESFLDCETQLH